MCKEYLVIIISGLFAASAFAMQQPQEQPPAGAPQQQLNGIGILHGFLDRGAHYDILLEQLERRRNATNIAVAMGVGAFAGYSRWSKILEALPRFSIMSRLVNTRAMPAIATAGSVIFGVVTCAACWTFLNYFGNFLRINPVIQWLPARCVNNSLNEIKHHLEAGIKPGRSDTQGNSAVAPVISVHDLGAMRDILAADPVAQQSENKKLTDQKIQLLQELNVKALCGACHGGR